MSHVRQTYKRLLLILTRRHRKVIYNNCQIHIVKSEKECLTESFLLFGCIFLVFLHYGC